MSGYAALSLLALFARTVQADHGFFGRSGKYKGEDKGEDKGDFNEHSVRIPA